MNLKKTKVGKRDFDKYNNKKITINNKKLKTIFFSSLDIS
jgi:hypothetical protein